MKQAKSLRLTSEEWEKISQCAAERGISPSEWVREIVLNAVKHPDDQLSFPRGMMEEKLYKRVKLIHCMLVQHYEDREDVAFMKRAKAKAEEAL